MLSNEFGRSYGQQIVLQCLLDKYGETISVTIIEGEPYIARIPVRWVGHVRIETTFRLHYHYAEIYSSFHNTDIDIYYADPRFEDKLAYACCGCRKQNPWHPFG